MADRTNREWIEALASGAVQQDEALADLRSHLERSALFYLRRRLGGSNDVPADEVQSLAEDLAQDASLLVLQRLSTYRGEARFLTWASAFAVKLAMTTLRRKMWQDLSLDRMPDGWQEPPSSAIGSSGWADPQLEAQRLAIWETVRDIVLNELTPRQREALNMIVINGMPTEVVEDCLQMTPSALYKMTHDARRKLKVGLAKRGFTVQEILGAFEAET